MHLNTDQMLARVDSRFTLVILAAKRARQITNYLNSLGQHGVTDFQGAEFEMAKEKPLSIAFGEVAQGKVGYERSSDGIK